MRGFVEDEAVTGVLSAFPLNQEGFGRLKRGAFDAFNLASIKRLNANQN